MWVILTSAPIPATCWRYCSARPQSGWYQIIVLLRGDSGVTWKCKCRNLLMRTLRLQVQIRWLHILSWRVCWLTSIKWSDPSAICYLCLPKNRHSWVAAVGVGAILLLTATNCVTTLNIWRNPASVVSSAQRCSTWLSWQLSSIEIYILLCG